MKLNRELHQRIELEIDKVLKVRPLLLNVTFDPRVDQGVVSLIIKPEIAGTEKPDVVEGPDIWKGKILLTLLKTITRFVGMFLPRTKWSILRINIGGKVIDEELEEELTGIIERKFKIYYFVERKDRILSCLSFTLQRTSGTPERIKPIINSDIGVQPI